MKRTAAYLALSSILLTSGAHADVVFDGSVGEPGPAPSGVIGSTVVDYLIEPGRGALRGGNLFFSFTRFSIEPQRIAAFNGPSDIQNVIARVTGDEITRIDGTLGSAIAGADVWLLNPSGVIFGAGSRLELGGALYVSTADYLRLADGSRFAADLGDVSTLTVAAPEAFGFLGSSTGRIDVDVSGTVLRGRAFERLALVGGDISIHAGAGDQVGYLWAQNGRIDLAAIASDGSAPAEVALVADGAAVLTASGPFRGRSIAIDRDAVLSSSGVNPSGSFGAFEQGAGDIAILGESLTIDDAELSSLTGGMEAGGDIDIRLSGDLILRSRDEENAGIFAGTGVRIGNTQLLGAGDGGAISISARNVSILDGAQVATTSIWVGDAGSITISARETVRISGRDSHGLPGGAFSRTTIEGAGGAISIGAERLELDHGGALVTETRGTANGGSIYVDVAQLAIQNGGRIDSSTRSATTPPGDGGTIRINASKSVRISGRESDDVFSGITAIAQGATDTLPASTARAGDIRIETPLLAVSNGGTISTQALGSGDGGSIGIGVRELWMNGGIIRASALVGEGGTIAINATQRATFVGGSEVSTRASGAGDAGAIEIDGGQELTIEDSAITAESEVSNGAGISLRARKLLEMHRGVVSTSVGGGLGGDIDIDPEYVVLNESRIIARAGSGSGGNIRIVAGNFVSDASSTVDASSQTGIDGSVSIDSPEVDQNSALDVLPSDYADASTLLRAACASRTGAGSGSFVVRAGARAQAAPDAPLGADDASAGDGTACTNEPAR